nr:hypothetical protein [Rhodococcus wratislaviensis]GLK38714.1 hypothetical protein GCM10017611_55830 [Rhodococcus wratislaviensis]
MIVIGIDPHKSTHTGTAVDPATNTDLGSIRIDATLTGYRTLIAWAKSWPRRQWAVENAEGLGHHLAQWLLVPGETVLDIPTTATARSGNSPAAGAARTTASTPPQRRVLPRCRATPARWTRRVPPISWPCSTNVDEPV